MRAVIFVWAELAALPVEIKKDDFIICADVGLKTAERFGVRPSVVIGDFDSYPNGRLYNGEKVVLPVEKDDTDTHYAVRYALDRGADEIVIVGGIGGAREDHTFANIATLRYIYSRGAKGYIITDRARIDYLENGTLTLPAEEKSVNVTVFSSPDRNRACHRTRTEIQRRKDRVLCRRPALGKQFHASRHGSDCNRSCR